MVIMKAIYLIGHSVSFVEIDNYTVYKSISWEEYNKNMILSVKGEKMLKNYVMSNKKYGNTIC